MFLSTASFMLAKPSCTALSFNTLSVPCLLELSQQYADERHPVEQCAQDVPCTCKAAAWYLGPVHSVQPHSVLCPVFTCA